MKKGDLLLSGIGDAAVSIWSLRFGIGFRETIGVILLTENKPESPALLSLSIIHKLQTELSAELNALQQHLDTQPAPPQGFPPGRTITMPGQIAAHLGNGLPEAPVVISVGVWPACAATMASTSVSSTSYAGRSGSQR